MEGAGHVAPAEVNVGHRALKTAMTGKACEFLDVETSASKVGQAQVAQRVRAETRGLM